MLQWSVFDFSPYDFILVESKCRFNRFYTDNYTVIVHQIDTSFKTTQQFPIFAAVLNKSN